MGRWLPRWGKGWKKVGSGPILFVDDEKRRMSSYIEELEASGYQVVFLHDVDSAWRFLEGNSGGTELLILDIMIPSGQIFKNKNTEEGLRTGVFFFNKVREKAPDLPVIILTNVSNREVSEGFQQEEKCWFFRKEDCFPFELAEKVKEILKQ